MTQKKDPPKELAHYGVKGMKWGVKKARTGDLQGHIKKLDRVASGKGSALDKLHTIGNSTLLDLHERGVRGNAAHIRDQLQAEHDRLANGQAKTRDLLRAYGSVSLVSVLRSMHD